MKITHKHNSRIIDLILICLISYINFYSGTGSLPVTIVLSILLTVVFSSGTVLMSVIKLAVGLALSLVLCIYEYSAISLDFFIGFLDLYMPSFILQMCLRYKTNNLNKTVYYTAAGHIFVSCLSLAKVKYIDKSDLINEISLMFDELSEMYTTLIPMSSDMVNIKDVAEIVELIKNTTIMFIPAFIIVSCIVLSYIQIALSRGIIKTYLKEEHNEIEYFYQIRIGKLLSTITIILLLISFGSDSVYFASAIYNFAFVAGFIYIINGLSVLYFYLIKTVRNIPVSILLIIIILVVSIFISALMPMANIFTILFILGFLDSSANFRKLKKVGD